MNILIIDDEPLTVEMLKKKIPWHTIPIDQVYTANDTAFARQILATFPVHIILCDIEMPGESGLEFLRWLSGNGPKNTVNLLLTCHDDFQYAREAIQLNVLEYILKPVAYGELTAILKKAAAEYESRYSEQLHIQAGQLWEKHKNSVVKACWQDFFAGSREKSPEQPDDLGISKNEAYLLALFSQRDSFKTLNSRDILILLEQQLQPVFSFIHMEFSLFSPESCCYYLIAWGKSPDNHQETLQYVFAQLKKILYSLHLNQINLCGCMHNFTDFHSLLRENQALLAFLKKQDDVKTGLFLIDTSAAVSEQYGQIISGDLFQKLSTYIHRHLAEDISRQDLADHVHLNADYLTRFFKKKTGMTLTDYIRTERLNYGAQLLKNTGLSIAEIALATGFCTPSYFSSSFKKQFGCSPADYRIS